MRTKKRGNWAISDAYGKIIRRGFIYKLAATQEMQNCRVHKREKLQVVRE